MNKIGIFLWRTVFGLVGLICLLVGASFIWAAKGCGSASHVFEIKR